MEERGSYGQFCPVAMAAELVCSRWTVLIIRELLCGSSRFNELRRGVPRMSPTLLSRRLKELEEAGIIHTKPAGPGIVDYRLTAAGEELRNVVMALGCWGQRWVESSLSLDKLDVSLLMWDMRRHLDPKPLPIKPRCTILFQYPELVAARQNWWLVIDAGEVDLCSTDPGYEVDLYVSARLKSMTAIWMGLSTVERELSAGTIELTGNRLIARSMQKWLGLSPFAKEQPRIAA